MYNIFDVVKTKKALGDKSSCTLERGSQGTILEVYTRGKEVGYNVEFIDSRGNTTAVLVVDETDIEPLEVAPGAESNNNIVSFKARQKKVTQMSNNSVTTHRSTTGKAVAAKAGKPINGKTASRVASKAGKKAATPKPKKPTSRRSK